jgi:hypothetical protein
MSRNFSLDWSICTLVLCLLKARISRSNGENPSSLGSHQWWISGNRHISAIFLRKVGGNMYLVRKTTSVWRCAENIDDKLTLSAQQWPFSFYTTLCASRLS